jgi:hypothetical protein
LAEGAALDLFAVNGGVDAAELLLLGLVDAQYTRRPFYGTQRMVVYLSEDRRAGRSRSGRSSSVFAGCRAASSAEHTA